MSGISVNQLKSFTQNADTELRLTGAGERQAGKIEMREGSFGGRMMRNLKIAFSGENREIRQAEYGGAKQAILDAMKANFGEEIGTKAFQAGVGRMHKDGHHESSTDHPLTGRHIEKMLRAAADLGADGNKAIDRNDGADDVVEAGEVLSHTVIEGYPDLKFEKNSEGLDAGLGEVLGEDFTGSIDEAFDAQFDGMELGFVQDMPYLSPLLLQRLGQRDEAPTISTSGGQVPLAGNSDRDIAELIQVAVPPSRTNPEGGGGEVSDTGRKLLSRFMNDEPFQKLYAGTMAKLHPDQPVGEASVAITITARRDEDDSVVFDVEFKAPLPKTGDGRDADLIMKVSVPGAELNAHVPAIDYYDPWVRVGGETPRLDDDSIAEIGDDDVGMSDIESIDDDEIIDDQPVGFRDGPLGGVKVSHLVDTDKVTESTLKSLGRDATRLEAGGAVGELIDARMHDLKPSLMIGVNGGAPEDLSKSIALPQLANFAGRNGEQWELSQTERGGLSRFVGGHAFEQTYAEVIGTPGQAPPSFTATITAVSGDDGPEFHISFRAPLPDDAKIDLGEYGRDGGRFDLEMTLIVPRHQLTLRQPDFVMNEPEVVRR